MKELLLDLAPGKETIHKIIDHCLFEDVFAFYKVRISWYKYPIIYDNYKTYGLFDDLVNSIPNDAQTISMLIDHALDIASKEIDTKLINSVFFISNLTFKGQEVCFPSKSQLKKITELKPRVQRLSFIPNMSVFWNSMLSYFIKDNTFESGSFIIKEEQV
jgi:hypothetical protein